MDPVECADGHNDPGRSTSLFQALTKVVDDFVMGCEDPTAVEAQSGCKLWAERRVAGRRITFPAQRLGSKSRQLRWVSAPNSLLPSLLNVRNLLYYN